MAALFVVIGFHDVADDRRSRGAAPASALYQCRDHDFGIAARSVSDEPAVFLQFFAQFILQVEALNLSRAGLAGKVDVLLLYLFGGGAIGFIDDSPHTVGDLLDRVFRKREGPKLQVRGSF